MSVRQIKKSTKTGNKYKPFSCKNRLLISENIQHVKIDKRQSGSSSPILFSENKELDLNSFNEAFKLSALTDRLRMENL